MRQNFLHTINPRCSIDDIELLAKYVYCRKNSENGKNGSVDSSISFRDLNDGLKTCFVDRNGKMKSFKDIHIYLKKHLGFSSFMTDHNFIYTYLCGIANNLNISSSVDELKSIEKLICGKEERFFSKKIEDKIFNKLSELSKIEFNGYRSSPLKYDQYAFLFDLLYQREAINEHYEKIKEEVDIIISGINDLIANNLKKQYAILYSVIFLTLYQLHKNFFGYWKIYYDKEDYSCLGVEHDTDQKYSTLKNLASESSTIMFEIKKPKESNKTHFYLYPCLVFIETFLNKYNIEKNAETMNEFYLRYTKGGRILTTEKVFLDSFFACEYVDNLDIRNVIDTLNYIDMSETVLKARRNSRTNKVNPFKLPSMIYNLLIKCFLYYIDKDIINRITINKYLLKCFSYHFIKKELFLHDHLENPHSENNYLVSVFNSNEVSDNDINSSSELYHALNEYIYKPNAKFHKNFFKEFCDYEYIYIDSLRTLNKLNKDVHSSAKKLCEPISLKLKYFFENNDVSRKNYYTQSTNLFKSNLDNLLHQ